MSRIERYGIRFGKIFPAGRGAQMGSFTASVLHCSQCARKFDPRQTPKEYVAYKVCCSKRCYRKWKVAFKIEMEAGREERVRLFLLKKNQIIP